jgi:hypothetical protein
VFEPRIEPPFSHRFLNARDRALYCREGLRLPLPEPGRPIDCTELPILELDAAQLLWIMGDIDRGDAAVAHTPGSIAGSRMTKPASPLTMAGQTL